MFVYCVSIAWNYEESDVVFISLSKSSCVSFLSQHRELKRFHSVIYKVKLDKIYFHGIRRSRKIKF